MLFINKINTPPAPPERSPWKALRNETFAIQKGFFLKLFIN